MNVPKLLMLPVLLTGAAVAAPSSDGLYATLQTTMGNVCFELYYTNVPRTVANFVSLAEGSRPWLDPRTGFISNKPYYNGIIFHRVISGFMIQGGSPKGDGMDGPGYYFSDEFDSSLKHNQPGIVSMANSGPNSNGGQFFITATSTPGLDNVHSVFGRVVEGMSIVSNIAAVATDTNDHPLADITITNVFITRNGSSAQAFNPKAVTPSLPDVRPILTKLYWEDGQFLAGWTQHDSCAYWFFWSDNMMAGWRDLFGYSGQGSAVDITEATIYYKQCFFNVTEVLYYE